MIKMSAEGKAMVEALAHAISKDVARFRLQELDIGWLQDPKEFGERCSRDAMMIAYGLYSELEKILKEDIHVEEPPQKKQETDNPIPKSVLNKFKNEDGVITITSENFDDALALTEKQIDNLRNRAKAHNMGPHVEESLKLLKEYLLANRGSALAVLKSKNI